MIPSFFIDHKRNKRVDYNEVNYSDAPNFIKYDIRSVIILNSEQNLKWKLPKVIYITYPKGKREYPHAITLPKNWKL